MDYQNPFRTPLPITQPQLWFATYDLPRKIFLEAVEVAIERVPPPQAGLHWEYEGFNRFNLYIVPVSDTDTELYQSISLGFLATANKIIISVCSANTLHLKLFRYLTIELDSMPHVARACMTPCTRNDLLGGDYVSENP